MSVERRLTLQSKPEVKRSLYSLMLADKRMLFLFTPEQQFFLPELSCLQKEVLLLSDGTRTVHDMVTILNEKGISCSEEDVLNELNGLYDRLVLEDCKEPADEMLLTEELKEKFDRQLLYFAAQKKQGRQYALELQYNLQNTHVVIIGIGCLGSHILYGLSAVGIGKITLLDFDVVELSNLNRQCMYSEEDVGKSKIEVLKERCQTVSRTTSYGFIEKKIRSRDDFIQIIEHTSPDLVILTADSPRQKIFSWMNEASYTTGVPALFTIGVMQSFLYAGPLVVPGETACYECSMPAVDFMYGDPLIEFIHQRHRHGTIAPHAMTLAGIMTLEVLKHLTAFTPCQLYNHRLALNVFTYETQMIKVNRRNTCSFCGKT
jgi:molybdopterin/thiamine biosynthesis adenylyltransferase